MTCILCSLAAAAVWRVFLRVSVYFLRACRSSLKTTKKSDWMTKELSNRKKNLISTVACSDKVGAQLSKF